MRDSIRVCIKIFFKQPLEKMIYQKHIHTDFQDSKMDEHLWMAINILDSDPPTECVKMLNVFEI
jgi:hypothetical protein